MPTANELNVDTTATALDMADAIFGDGVTVTNATYTGAATASGTYTGGTATLGELTQSDTGVILSTGNVADFTNSSGTPDTNTSDGTSTDHTGVGEVDGDADLDAVSGQATQDGAFFEADFIAENDLLTMQFVFTSEEYLEYVNGGVNDAFGVWVNGAYVPLTLADGSTQNVSIDTINDTSTSNLYLDNPAAVDSYNTEMDGGTVVLSLSAPVNPGDSNNIRIGIGDGGDSAYDSNVLIMGDSIQTVSIAASDQFAQGPNTTQVHDLLSNDINYDGNALTITHINNVAVSVGETVTLPSGEQITLNPDMTVDILTDGDIGTNDFTYSTIDSASNTATGYATIETTTTPPDYIVEGTAGDDVIDAAYTGDPEGDLIDANDHSDASNADSVVAGAGNDSVVAGDGSDTVFGQDGSDTILGGAGDDELDGDDAAATGGADSIDGGAGNDQIVGDVGNDTLIGGDGADSIDGGAGDDTIYGDQAPQPGIWDYQVYDYDFGNVGDQAFDIENGTLVGAGQTSTFDATNLVNDARGTTGDPDDFGMIYTSQLLPDEDGTYTFSTTSDDGSTIRILDENGDPLTWTQDGSSATFMDNDYLQGANTRSGEVTLEAGKVYTIEVRHWENEGAEVISGTVTSPSGTPEDLANSSMIIGPAPNAPGADNITGGIGDDAIFAGDGDDTVDGGAGADSVDGGAGNDTITVDQGDTATGGTGDDYFILEDVDTSGTGNATVDITGGEDDETAGDTLQLTSDVTLADITFTNTDDANGGLSGTFTMADGTVVNFDEIENIICFTPGTRILTALGERPIDDLREGDMVVTRDHGLRPIRWIGKRRVPGKGRFAPVCVGANALEGGQSGLLVSPQHRILFTGYRAELLFGESEVLVPAKHLIDGRDVVQQNVEEVTYIHLMLDRHEVIYAEGIATESFHAGDIGLGAVDEAAREELFEIFPELRAAPYRHGKTARPCLRAHEAQLLKAQAV